MNGQARLFKAPLPASEFINHPEYLSLLASIGDQTSLVLGHTRYPTKGEPTLEMNNHPIQAGPVLGVHNGHIKNDDDLFEQLGYPRRAEVDSEIIFQMLAASSPENPLQYLSEIKPHLEMLEGQFTFISVDCRAPDQLLVFKHDNPLCIHYHTDWDALILSSRYIFLRKTFGPIINIETLEQDTLLLFNALSINQFHSKPSLSIPISTPNH